MVENAYIEQPAVRAALGGVRGLDILDAGCGLGILIEYLIGRGAGSVTGVDVTPRMVELAHERAPQAKPATSRSSEPAPHSCRSIRRRGLLIGAPRFGTWLCGLIGDGIWLTLYDSRCQRDR